MNNYPKNAMPCWQVSEEQIRKAKEKGEPLGNFLTSEYFLLVGRIDNLFIEGYIGRLDRRDEFLNDVREQLTYLIEYFEHKKVYFTFDRITIYKLVEIYPSHPNPIRFILRRVDSGIVYKKGQAFMIMPFHHIELDSFYFDAIKPFLKKELSMDIYRADDFRDNDIIIETIYRLIEESELVIADTTKENKNSFYELGFASALGKEIITIQNRNIEQKLFFDRAHIRTILYDFNDISTFQFDMGSTIKSIRNREF